jgi:hypothetical protein
MAPSKIAPSIFAPSPTNSRSASDALTLVRGERVKGLPSGFELVTGKNPRHKTSERHFYIDAEWGGVQFAWSLRDFG